MEGYAKNKINRVIEGFQRFDSYKHPELYDELLFRRYLAKQNDFQELAAFLTAAQLELANCVLPFNESISSGILLESLLKNLESTLNDLSTFAKMIRDEAEYELDLDSGFPREQIEHVIQTLQRYRPSRWETPISHYRFNERLMTEQPIFSVRPITNIANSTIIALDTWRLLPQHSSSSNGIIRLHIPQADTPKKGKDPQVRQPSSTQAGQAGRKHYTVFVSSTFEDMKDIRAAVLGRLYSTEDFMPIGMENFMASDSSQLDYIRERLNDTDIYVLLLGGRYGTLTPRGDRSYTHEEYEMAKANPDVRVLSFVCNQPENLPAERRWRNDDEHDRLMEFTKEVESNKMVRTWAVDTDPEKIAGDVYQSLVDETKKGTMRGWIRGKWPEPER